MHSIYDDIVGDTELNNIHGVVSTDMFNIQNAMNNGQLICDILVSMFQSGNALWFRKQSFDGRRES